MCEGWREVPLGRLLRPRRETIQPRTGARYKQLTLAINGRGARLRREIDGAAARRSRQYAVRAGDLIVSKIDARKGAAAVVPADLDGGIVTADFPTYEIDVTQALPHFLDLIVRRPEFAQLADTISAGTTNRVRMDLSRFPDIRILLPPVAEQRRIVDLVSSLDELIRLTDGLLASAGACGTALRDTVFAAETTKARPLGTLCGRDGIQIGPFGSQLHARDYVTAGIPVVMPQDMVDGAISERSIARVSTTDANRLARYRLEPGDILLPRRGDLTKRALLLEEQRGWLCGTGTVRVRVSKVAPEVVFEALSTSETSRWLADHAVGITLPNLNTDIVSSIPVRLPANPEAAVRSLAELQEVWMLAGRHGRAARALRVALLHDLLGGTTEIPESYNRFLDGAA
ncbi:MAG: hypothetical protein ABSG37_13475 [Candidatus Limnocylindrales bacterium]|jgi:type I restriction enzyme S subunit